MKNIILALMFIQTILFSQTYEYDDQYFSPVEDFYKLNYLNGKNNGKGNTGIAADNEISAAYLNPAALDLSSKYQINVQYTYKTTQSITLPILTTGISYDLKHLFPAVYIGFGYKVSDKLQTGFIYSNPGGRKLVYTKGIETVNGEVVYNNMVIHSFGIPVSYKLNNFSIGIILDSKLYTVEYNGVSTINDPNGNYTLRTDLWNFNAQFGLKFEPEKNLSLGLTFTPGFHKEVKYDNEVVVTERYVSISRYPMKIGGGFEYRLMKDKLKLAADYNFEQLSELSGHKDKHDFNIGAEYTAGKNVNLRFGFFTFLDNRKFNDPNISSIFSEGEFSQYFITAGFTYKTQNIDISASILDSHISSGIIKNTYFNTSISYNF